MTSKHFQASLLIIVLIICFALLIFVQSFDKTLYEKSAMILPHLPTASTSTKILFVGDMFFDRHIRTAARTHGEDFLFSCIDPLFQEADFVVGNLEGPITTHKSVSEGSIAGSAANYRFTFPTSTAEMLARHNVKIVNLGNNHISNFGVEGIASTKQYLDAAGVSYFGGVAGNSQILQTTQNGLKMSFINYNQFGGETPEKVAAQIAAEHASGRKVIVYAHWGEEYIKTTPHEKATAKLFEEHGADLIIGSHPHVVQEHELIDSTPVYYSLGNFLFDQYFEENVMNGLALLVTISKDNVKIEEKPVRIGKDGRMCEK